MEDRKHENFEIGDRVCVVTNWRLAESGMVISADDPAYGVQLDKTGETRSALKDDMFGLHDHEQVLPNVTPLGDGGQPYVGMGGTLGGFGIDRHPVTVKAVSKHAKSVWVDHDDWVRIDKNGISESQSYVFLTPYDSPRDNWTEYTLRKNGRWVRKGDDLHHGSTLWLGFRERWYNFSH